MDSVTQALLGGAIQGSLLGRAQGRRALFYGAALATLPDLDVVIPYADPVSMMTYHRGFSHSIFVLTGLAALLSWLIRQRWPAAPYSGGRLFLTLWLVLVTHPVLDAFTVYGTQLFWPIPSIPESWSAIFIIDPFYTLPLLAAVFFAAVKGVNARGVGVLCCALAFSTAYLAFGLGGRMLAEQRVQQAMSNQGITATKVLAVSMPFNTLLWRVIAKTPDGHYYESVSSWFDDQPPEWVRLPLNPDIARLLDGVPLHDRLRWFTNDWLRYDIIGDSLVVSDLRMGIAGNYSFRFKMAQCDADGHWNAVVPTTWPDGMAGMEKLQPMIRRIFHQQPPLPLADWSDRYRETSAARACEVAVSADASDKLDAVAPAGGK
ncbi:metal-dependent hydrolase [Brenneria tiliae]|uniref:Metal-dependent hydrolase n=1 Tax=Brenneria tiliae TaxID=2914984 RepID=A0ABT0MWM8_9GAMM|nr:metal-dependent hydrolase [Brenneria tiliae]MCL2894248.1 metal-dependent hydrolase [Brenneria tiliae]MCL2898765.1 metal-dependent hydrolase [Brenneria tiliae]MCL2903298.1 metal-dependent hydrolase [Brenneria tiliae]